MMWALSSIHFHILMGRWFPPEIALYGEQLGHYHIVFSESF